MTIEIQDLFDRAGCSAPPSTVDLDLAVRRGRRLRARRRAVVGTGSLLGVGVVVAGAVKLLPDPATGAGPGAPIASATEPGIVPLPTPVSTAPAPTPGGPAATDPAMPTPSGTSGTTKYGTPPPALAAVTLTDPAPGFPIRRFVDAVDLTNIGPSAVPQWVATFGVSVRPETPLRDSAGHVTGGAPNGPEATILVGTFDLPARAADGTIEGHPVVASPLVAGVTGQATSFAEKGTPMVELYFRTGAFTVEAIGFGDVTTEELVALGNALSGLE
jgi:hypothetical protein